MEEGSSEVVEGAAEEAADDGRVEVGVSDETACRTTKRETSTRT